MTQLGATQNLLKCLYSQGVEDFVVCAGSRNACFVELLSKSSKLKSYFHFEERSAAFFALGLSRKNKRPIVIVVTSGTAVANLLPAVIESYYGGGSLLLITADRPQSYRGSGAPQAIEQSHIFDGFVEKKYDVSSKDIPQIEIGRGNIHLNLSFDEPIVDGNIDNHFDQLWTQQERAQKFPSTVMVPKPVEKPLLLLSRLQKGESQKLASLLEKRGFPVLIEGCVGEIQSKLSHRVCESEAQSLIDSGAVSSLIRIGGVPISRLWRDLELRYKSLPVVNFSSLSFSGLSRKSEMYFSDRYIDTALEYLSKIPKLQISLDKYSSSRKKKSEIYGKFPRSEAAFFKEFSHGLTQSDHLFLGNSLPVRNWLEHCEDSSVGKLSFCRGANGIDGLISLCLGLIESTKSHWCVIGDLTAMYDLAGLWGLRFFKSSEKFNLVIVNNKGGKIFSRLYQNPAFQCGHEQDFSFIAKFYNMNYVKVNTVSEMKNCMDLGSQFNLIEWNIDSVESAEFNSQWQKLN